MVIFNSYVKLPEGKSYWNSFPLFETQARASAFRRALLSIVALSLSNEAVVPSCTFFSYDQWHVFREENM
jgi:hypothetical protein